MKLDLQGTPEEVMRGVEALQAYGEELDLEFKTLFGLTLALEECASNVVNHALQGDAARTFTVEFEVVEGEMVLEIRDSGAPFDPTVAPEREPCAEDDDEPPGGWGIQLVRKFTDEMLYSREGEENVLRLTKRLDSA
jgi:anti-sigma regulatory factor (Ser/Thr protein kinase)